MDCILSIWAAPIWGQSTKNERRSGVKWVRGLTAEERKRRSENWLPWFAWYPVTIGRTPEGREIKVWLSYVERKGVYNTNQDYGHWWNWGYRKMKSDGTGIEIDFSYANLPRERVIEWARLPSGRIVAITKHESFWFESNGKSPKGSFLTPWSPK
jgi:hypothetical protein